MKKGKFKKLIALVIGATMLVPTISVKAVTKEEQAKKYVALGDSISYGMSAEPGKGYVDLFYNKLKLQDKDITFKNLSIPGATSSDLLKTVEANVQELQEAEVVTISIGGNNFLKPTIMAVSTALGVDPTSKELGKEVRVKISTDYKGSMARLASLKDNKTYIEALGQGANQLFNDFTKTIALVKKVAPQAKIYVNNLYNPFPQTNPFYSVYEKICTNINAQLEILASERYGSGCKVVDAYSLFKGKSDYVNFDFVTGNVDPHPSNIGHAALSERLISVRESDLKSSSELSKNEYNDDIKVWIQNLIKQFMQVK